MWVFFHGSSKIQRPEEIASPPVIPMSYVLLDVDGRVLSYDCVSSDLSFEPREIFTKITNPSISPLKEFLRQTKRISS